MKAKLLVSLFIGFLTICGADKDTKENKDSKDKRQIGIHQTRVNPHQQIPDNAQLETVFGAHPNQFVIRAVGQGQPQLQYQPQQQVASQAEQLQEVGPQHFNYVPEAAQPQQGKAAGQAKQYPKKAQLQRPVQYVQEVPQYVNQYQEQPYPHISEEQILRLLQEELKQQSAVVEQRQPLHRAQKPQVQDHNPKQGLGQYREGPANGPAIFSYSPQNVPQQYYSQVPLDYHRAVPDHPLAASSLERELEKLVASNKPSAQYRQQQQTYKTPKPQSKPQPAQPAPEEKGFSFFPDFSQLSSFNLPQGSFLEQAPAPQKHASNHGQYLTEVTPKQKAKPTSSPYQQKSQFYSSQQKSQSQYVPVTEGKNAALKVIDAPVLQYERAQAATPTPELYYRSPAPQAPLQSHLEPSRSSIYVSQATGLRPTAQSPQQEKQYSQEKVVRLPPPDGKPISQEEFQALVDAGYPVEAVPVPVPVPYEKFIQRPEYRQIQEQPGAGVRRVKEDRQEITYLHPVALRQNQGKQPLQKGSS